MEFTIILFSIYLENFKKIRFLWFFYIEIYFIISDNSLNRIIVLKNVFILKVRNKVINYIGIIFK